MGYEQEILGLRAELAAERAAQAGAQLQRELAQQQRDQAFGQQSTAAQTKLLEVASLLTARDVPVSDLTTPSSWHTEERVSTGWPVMSARGRALQDNDIVRYVIGVTRHGRMFTSDTTCTHAGRPISYAKIMSRPNLEVRVPELRGFKMGILSLIQHGEPYQDQSDDYFQLSDQNP